MWVYSDGRNDDSVWCVKKKISCVPRFTEKKIEICFIAVPKQEQNNSVFFILF